MNREKPKPYSVHRHHIIPKYMGGGDSDGNLVTLTVEEHAEAHKALWEEHGNWQDRLAWMSLSRQMTQDEVRLEARRHAVGDFHRGRKRSAETKKRLSEALKGNTNSRGTKIKKPRTDAYRKAQSEAQTGRVHPPRKKIACHKCGKVVAPNAIARWHGDKCGNHNFSHTAESRKKISESKTGKKRAK